MLSTAANQFILLEHMVEPLRKNNGEDDVEAIRRIVRDHAERGWEIVEACGDEVRMPVLIFRKLALQEGVPEYIIEEIPPARGEDEIAAVTERLWQMRDENFMPACILDSPISKPVAVFKKSSKPLTDVRIEVVVVPLVVFERIGTAIVYELLDQQVCKNLTLACIIHGGLNPILVLTANDSGTPYQYLVDYAKSGIFSNKATTLATLIQSRTGEGWEVCGAFEDAFLWPCVVFRRKTESVPVAPVEISG